MENVEAELMRGAPQKASANISEGYTLDNLDGLADDLYNAAVDGRTFEATVGLYEGGEFGSQGIIESVANCLSSIYGSDKSIDEDAEWQDIEEELQGEIESTVLQRHNVRQGQATDAAIRILDGVDVVSQGEDRYEITYEPAEEVLEEGLDVVPGKSVGPSKGYVFSDD